MSRFTDVSAVGRAIRSICERIDTPCSRDLASCIDSGLYVKLQHDYGITEQVKFAENYFVTKILSKWKGWRSGVVPADVAALNAWLAVELQCKATNERLLGLQRGTGFPGSYLTTVISTAQRNISEILGQFDCRKVLQKCSWGPGATADHPRGTLRDKKMTHRMSVTREALPYMKIVIESDPVWMEALTGHRPCGPCSILPSFWEICVSSRFTTVPKEVLIDRCIDIQPTANGFLQSGTGRYMRGRLKRFGIDLNSQEANQIGAFMGYFSDDATVDLRSASDSNAAMLCTLLLPWQWNEWLNKLRTQYTTLPDGSMHKLQKISSMGNGYTFELETIVFYAIAKAVCEVEDLSQERILVYGDDLIVPSDAYDGLVYTLNYCGFEVNLDKSFKSGPFRESCGKHYFRGADVTPAYQKSLVNSPEECIRFHNRLVRWSERTYGDPWIFEEALTLCMVQFDSYRSKTLHFAKTPKVPIGSVSDDGFLMPLEAFDVDDNGGILTYVYRKSKAKSESRINETCHYALKLRSGRISTEVESHDLTRVDASLMNASREGYVYEDTGKGRYRLSRAYIHATSYSV